METMSSWNTSSANNDMGHIVKVSHFWPKNALNEFASRQARKPPKLAKRRRQAAAWSLSRSTEFARKGRSLASRRRPGGNVRLAAYAAI
jgi:hypothetical protein